MRERERARERYINFSFSKTFSLSLLIFCINPSLCLYLLVFANTQNVCFSVKFQLRLICSSEVMWGNNSPRNNSYHQQLSGFWPSGGCWCSPGPPTPPHSSPRQLHQYLFVNKSQDVNPRMKIRIATNNSATSSIRRTWEAFEFLFQFQDVDCLISYLRISLM